jgi:chromosome segregation protein
MHWARLRATAATCTAGGDGVAGAALSSALARRLAQIGVVERDAGARLCANLKTGQRLVSRDGDLWRWDGFVAAAHAPTGAARRLAQRSRFVEIDTELESARGDVDAKRHSLEAAQSAFDAARQR